MRNIITFVALSFLVVLWLVLAAAIVGTIEVSGFSPTLIPLMVIEAIVSIILIVVSNKMKEDF